MKTIAKQVQVIDENAKELTVKAYFEIDISRSLDVNPDEAENIKSIVIDGRILEKADCIDEEQFCDDVTGKIYTYAS